MIIDSDVRSDPLPIRYFMLLILPFAVALFGLWLFQWMVSAGEARQLAAAEALQSTTIGAEQGAKTKVSPSEAFLGAFYSWMGLACVGLLLYLSTIIFVGVRLARSVEKQTITGYFFCLIVLGVSAYLAYRAGFKLEFLRLGIQMNDPRLWDIAEKVRDLAPIGGSYEWFLGLANGLVLVLAILISFGMIATLGGRPKDCPIDEVSWHVVKLRHQRSLLFCGAAVFVVGVLALNAWLAIGAALFDVTTDDGKAMKAGYNAVTTGLSTYLGALYVAILAAVYSPAAAILALRADRLAEHWSGSLNPITKANWLKGQGLQLEWREQLTDFLALASPLIAGPVSSLVAGLKGI